MSDQWPTAWERYSRQMRFAPVGVEGQERLSRANVVLIGCGALGTTIANGLVRAGVGNLRIVDRDFVELNNLQRQMLFDETDVTDSLPKAEAARRKLKAINSTVQVEAEIVDANHRNLESLCERADLVLDGTDNFETRYLINDWAVKNSRPWIYGACVAASGLALTVIPGQTACLRCVFDHAPPPEANPTCETAGVLGPVVAMVANFQLIEALKILTGHSEQLTRKMFSFDAWAGHYTLINVQNAREQGDCICCHQRQFEYLEGQRGTGATLLCGRNAVQIRPANRERINLNELGDKLQAVTTRPIERNPYLIKAHIEPYTLTVFADGRTIVTGTDNLEKARSLHAQYIGN